MNGQNKYEGQTVMIVEDCEDIRAMLRMSLELKGLRVVEATNGAEAMEVARVEKPGLILMDLNLPLVDGLTATRNIREHSGTKQTPIVAVSAHVDLDSQLNAITAGCNDYVSKPIDFDKLDHCLIRFLPSQSGGAYQSRLQSAH
jgi:CheY-like chemotaxis protein